MTNRQKTFWENLFTRTSSKRTRQVNRGENTHRHRKLRFESLEDKSLLTSVGVSTIDSLAVEGVDNNYGSWQISRSGSVDYPCLVNFRLSGTASYGSDYFLCTSNGSDVPLLPDYDPETHIFYYSGSISINSGYSSVTLQLRPLNDAEKEPSETATIQLISYYCNQESGSASGNASITIEDNDDWIVSVSVTDGTAKEGPESSPNYGTYTITRSNETDTSHPLHVRFQMTGTASTSDYSLYAAGSNIIISPIPDPTTGVYIYTGEVYIPYGQTSTTVELRPTNDAEREQTETAIMTILPSTNEYGYGAYSVSDLSSNATVSIEDNDGWKVILTPDTPIVEDEDGNIIPTTLEEEGETEARYTVSRVDDGNNRSGDLTYSIAVTLSLSGQTDISDYCVSYSTNNSFWTLLSPSVFLGQISVTVSIPTNSESVRLKIKATNDSMIERLYESLDVVIVSAKKGSIEYAIDPTVHHLQIKDNDVLTLETVQYKNNEDLKSDPDSSGASTSWKDKIHWRKNQPSETLPVAYSSNKVLTTDATFSGDVDPAIRNQLKVCYQVIGIAEGDVSDWKNVSTTGTVSVTNCGWVSSFAEFMNVQEIVLSIPVLTLHWWFAVGDEPENDNHRHVQGDSQNPLYVILRTPRSDLYLTSVHTACNAAHGVSPLNAPQNPGETQDEWQARKDKPVFDAIWEKFAGLSIKKAKLQNGLVIETSLLTYYGKISTDTTILNQLEIESIGDVIQSPSQFASVAREQALTNYQYGYIPSLLFYQDGTCGVWTWFMIHVLGTQGIKANAHRIQVKPGISVNSFKVNSSAAGQGTTTPKECIWGDHGVVEFGGYVYDPSYGLEYGVKANALAVFMSQSVESIGTTRKKKPNEATQGYGEVYTAMSGSYQSADTYFEWYSAY